MEITIVLTLIAKAAEVLIAIINNQNEKEKREELLLYIQQLPDSPEKDKILKVLKEETAIVFIKFLNDIADKEFARRAKIARERTEAAFRKGILGGVLTVALALFVGCAPKARYYQDGPVAGVELPKTAPAPDRIYVLDVEGRTHVTWIREDD